FPISIYFSPAWLIGLLWLEQGSRAARQCATLLCPALAANLLIEAIKSPFTSIFGWLYAINGRYF
ncbi:MAG: hypothetical protein ACKO96_28295, partial [Flammeovirgaceae bacterium]